MVNLVNWPVNDIAYRQTSWEGLFCYAVSFTDPNTSKPHHTMADCLLRLSDPHVCLNDIKHTLWPGVEEYDLRHQEVFEAVRESDQQELAAWFDAENTSHSIELSAAVFLGETKPALCHRRTDEFFQVTRADLTSEGEDLVGAIERAYGGDPFHILTFTYP